MSDKREFFGKPLDFIALQYHPYEHTCEQFVSALMRDLPAFLKNMNNLKSMTGREVYPEQWMETFLAWNEFNTDG